MPKSHDHPLRGRRLRRAGPPAIQLLLPQLRKQHEVDFAVVNVENAAAGFGVTPPIARAFLEQGVDVMTSGNHIWDKQEIIEYIVKENLLLRPANLPAGHAGRRLRHGQGRPAQGRRAEPDGPRLHAADRLPVPQGRRRSWRELRKETPIILVDMHCEATSESQAWAGISTGG